MRGRHGHAAVEPELADREIEHLGADHADVDDIGAAVGRALDQRCGHRRRREPHVAADGDPARLELLDVRAPDRVGALLVELGRIEPAHVVRLEGSRVEHYRVKTRWACFCHTAMPGPSSTLQPPACTSSGIEA